MQPKNNEKFEKFQNKISAKYTKSQLFNLQCRQTTVDAKEKKKCRVKREIIAILVRVHVEELFQFCGTVRK